MRAHRGENQRADRVGALPCRLRPQEGLNRGGIGPRPEASGERAAIAGVLPRKAGQGDGLAQEEGRTDRRQEVSAETLQKAVALAEKLGHVFVATADSAGMPHVGAAGRLTPGPNGCVTVTARYCPGTVANLQENCRVAVVVWDPGGDLGFQIFGQVESSPIRGVLDGCAPEEQGSTGGPQVERSLLIQVNRVIDFSISPHSGAET